MQIRMESKKGSEVGSCAETMRVFMRDTEQRQAEWIDRLQNDPDTLSEIEDEVDQHFRHGAGHCLAAMLGQATSGPEMQEHVERVRDEATVDLRAPEPRRLRLRLLCGLVLFVTTMYCPPKRQREDDATETPAGLYPELAALGVFKGCSPALQYRVARTVALAPSIEVARKELAKQGLKLQKKVVRRIAEQLGTQLLVLRRRELAAWRAGELTPGRQLAGKRIAVQIDGGRVRVRKNKESREKRQKGERPEFTAEWREPKVMIIYEFDAHGQMERKDCFKLIDGTLQGPDHLAELVAFTLHR